MEENKVQDWSLVEIAGDFRFQSDQLVPPLELTTDVPNYRLDNAKQDFFGIVGFGPTRSLKVASVRTFQWEKDILDRMNHLSWVFAKRTGKCVCVGRASQGFSGAPLIDKNLRSFGVMSALASNETAGRPGTFVCDGDHLFVTRAKMFLPGVQRWENRTESKLAWDAPAEAVSFFHPAEEKLNRRSAKTC